MKELEENIIDGNLTQKEIIQLLLHNAQHMATRDEVKADIKELKTEINEDFKELKRELKQDISKLEDKILKVSDKFDKAQWLLVATLLTIVFKDYITSFLMK